MGREKGGDSGWETRVHPWRIHVDVWQNQYSIVKEKKFNLKKILRKRKEFRAVCPIANKHKAQISCSGFSIPRGSTCSH